VDELADINKETEKEQEVNDIDSKDTENMPDNQEDQDISGNASKETDSRETANAETEDLEESEESDSPDTKKKGGFFKKKEKKKDPKDEKIEELNDRLIRNMAEFDNFRKRTDREKSQMFEMGASDMVTKILPVIDDLERGLAAMSEADKNTAFAQGIEMVYKKLMTILSDAGVKPIEALGKEFDPNYHNAVMQAPSETYESGVVMQELQKGYMYKERILRHSMVMVAE